MLSTLFPLILCTFTLADVEGPIRLPTNCEVCRLLVSEFLQRLASTSSKDVLHVGHGIDTSRKKKIVYDKSELRLTEALHEPHICTSLRMYNVHAERPGWHRYARGESETMGTLQGLVNRGVNVVMDIPYDLWNETSAEVSDLEKRCYYIVERWEDDIEEWYFSRKPDSEPLLSYLCDKRALGDNEKDCLNESEVWDGVKVHELGDTDGENGKKNRAANGEL